MIKTSEKCDVILGVLFEVGSQVSTVLRNANNTYHKSKYADLTQVTDAIREPLQKAGSFVITGHHLDGQTMTVTTRILHKDGQFVENAVSFGLVKADPQAVGSAITYGRRYNLKSLFNLTDVDDDGNAATGLSNNDAPAASANGVRLPSTKQLEFAQKLASERSISMPDDAKNDAEACSAFIERTKGMPKPKAEAKPKTGHVVVKTAEKQPESQSTNGVSDKEFETYVKAVSDTTDIEGARAWVNGIAKNGKISKEQLANLVAILDGSAQQAVNE